MRRPTNFSIAPKGGWSVTIEGCGPEIRDYNFTAFMLEVHRRLASNGLDKHGWREYVLDLMCQQRPDIAQEVFDEPQKRAMTGEDVLRFLKTMWAGKEGGAQPVSEELQRQRVDTCMACPKLGYISCFIGCQTITHTVNSFMMGRDVPKFPQIHKMSCLECGCTASVKTMWPVDLLRKVDEQFELKPNYHLSCWMLTEPQNPNGRLEEGDSSANPPPEGT